MAIRKILTFLHETLSQLACYDNWTRIKLKVCGGMFVSNVSSKTVGYTRQECLLLIMTQAFSKV